MSILKVYKCHIPSVNVILPSGKACVFVNGVFRTKDEGEIGFFEREIALGHPHIFIDPAEVEVDEALVDPFEAMKHKIIEQYKAEMAAAAGNPDRDMGNTDQNLKLNVGTTRDVAEAAAGGSGKTLALTPPVAQTQQTPNAASLFGLSSLSLNKK